MQYSDLLSNIKTVEQARRLNSEIDILLDSLFTQNGLKDGLNTISAIHSQIIKESLLKNNINQNNLSMTREFLNGLRGELQKLKILTLCLAFEPRESTIDNFFTVVIQNLGNGIILDIKVDKTILGGAIIEYEGRYKDLSLRKRVDEVFATKKTEILAL